MNTPTPRTNRAWNVCGDDNAEGAWSFARTLEAELAKERATLSGVIQLKMHFENELATEREKVRVLRSACESICEEWGRNHNAPFLAGSNMEKHATAALAATEGAQ